MIRQILLNDSDILNKGDIDKTVIRFTVSSFISFYVYLSNVTAKPNGRLQNYIHVLNGGWGNQEVQKKNML